MFRCSYTEYIQICFTTKNIFYILEDISFFYNGKEPLSGLQVEAARPHLGVRKPCPVIRNRMSTTHAIMTRLLSPSFRSALYRIRNMPTRAQCLGALCSRARIIGNTFNIGHIRPFLSLSGLSHTCGIAVETSSFLTGTTHYILYIYFCQIVYN